MSASARHVWGALVIVYFVWGSTYLGIKVVVETLPPLFSAGSRFLAAGAILALVLAARGTASASRASSSCRARSWACCC
jgi:drug/metabolite transporter (DMT)-like permease